MKWTKVLLFNKIPSWNYKEWEIRKNLRDEWGYPYRLYRFSEYVADFKTLKMARNDVENFYKENKNVVH